MGRTPHRAAACQLRDRAVEAAANAFVVADLTLPDNPIVEVNSAFERTTGYAPAEVLGRNCRFLQGPGTDPAAVARIRAAVRARREATVTLLNYRRDGEPFWNELYLAPIPDATGAVTHFVGVQSDVTARVRAAELEAALAGEREAGRLKAEFLATMSHELRTPLTAIIGYAELLALGELVPEQAADLAAIADGGTRLLSMVDGVLRLADLEAGRVTLAPVATDLAVLVAEAARAAEPAARVKGLALRVETPPKLVVRADTDALRQALDALVDNAVRFTERGDIAISARTAAGGVEVAVADTGVGIAPGDLPVVFAAFRQAEGGATRRHGGAGMGLAIAKRLVELHGGTLAVASELGAGSTFTVRMPTGGGNST